MAWYPNADRSIKGNSAGSYTGGPYRGVLHSTEGGSASGAISAFKKNNSWSHFLVDDAGKVWQFLDTNVSGRSLRNLAGGVETNRRSAVQIEIVGFAGKPNEHPAAQMSSLWDLMRWIEANTGVKPKGPGRPFATAYGQNNLRFTNAEWDSFGGWCGHCHCPESDHWDPGSIDMNFLLSGATPAPPLTPTPLEETLMAQTIKHPTNGYVVLQASDGGIFAYEGAPFFGSLPSAGVTARAVDLAWTPDGNGYWILGEDGAIFAFGNAAYKGGLNGSPHLGNRKPIGIVTKNDGYIIVTFDPSQDGSPYDSYGFST